MANELALKLTNEQKWAPVKNLVLSWQFIASLIAIFSGPLWYGLVAYLFLSTFLFDPNGMIVKSFLVVAGSASLWLMFSYFPIIIRRGKTLRELRKAAEFGDEEAKQKYIKSRNNVSDFCRHLFGIAGIHICIPAFVALMLWNGMTDGMDVMKVDGKVRPSTRKESLQHMLHAMERHGIFKPINWK